MPGLGKKLPAIIMSIDEIKKYKVTSTIPRFIIKLLAISNNQTLLY